MTHIGFQWIYGIRLIINHLLRLLEGELHAQPMASPTLGVQTSQRRSHRRNRRGSHPPAADVHGIQSGAKKESAPSAGT